MTVLHYGPESPDLSLRSYKKSSLGDSCEMLIYLSLDCALRGNLYAEADSSGKIWLFTS